MAEKSDIPTVPPPDPPDSGVPPSQPAYPTSTAIMAVAEAAGM